MEAIMMAVALLMPMQNSGVKGTIVLKQEQGAVLVTGEVTGLKPGKHGFHIHMYGDTRAPDGASAGGHYNPGGTDHGAPGAAKHHQGDLGNIEADAQGVAKINVKATGVSLGNIIGRSIVVHADPDDLTTQPSGNAGARVAVGVIALAENK
jgi:Cu-Zn family superoxide dismutase